MKCHNILLNTQPFPRLPRLGAGSQS